VISSGRSDFDSWLVWFCEHYPEESQQITAIAAKQVYDAFYFCNCESCEYNKARWGGHPMHLHDGCQLPQPTPAFDPIKLGLLSA
jgi:hypothetical protein